MNLGSFTGVTVTGEPKCGAPKGVLSPTCAQKSRETVPFSAFALHILLANVKAQAAVDLMSVKAMGKPWGCGPSNLHSAVPGFDSTGTRQGLGFMLGVTAISKQRGHFATQ